MSEKFPKPIYHPEPIKTPKFSPESDKDLSLKALKLLEERERELAKEAMESKKTPKKGVMNLLGKGLKKGAEVLFLKPAKKAFSGRKEDIMEMPKASSLETEAESMIDLSRSEISKKELSEEIIRIEKLGLTPHEKEIVAISRITNKKNQQRF